jgi:hypothetical protein
MSEGLLKEMLDGGYISSQKHPQKDLTIYNYTPKAQYGRVWNEATLQCRGLVVDSKGIVRARPFRKFFNMEEHNPADIPDEPFDVYEKLDGSLGILFYYDGWTLATRGSFTSEQAVEGAKLLQYEPEHKDRTYLFEIIYPENKIVVDYGGMRDLVLLAMVETDTGVEFCPDSQDVFNTPKKYSGVELDKLKALALPNHEGFVVRFKSGFRVKVKFEEYVRLHRILTSVSNVIIWEYLRDGKSVDEILDRVPDEFYSWVRSTERDLLDRYSAIESQCKSDFCDLGDRKTTALHFKTKAYPGILFRMLDGKDYADAIWKMVRPKYCKPFIDTNE